LALARVISPQMRLWFAIIIALFWVGLAHAETSSKDARARYQAGILHYNLNEFPEALAEFKEAYRLKQDPAFLWNIAQCYRQLGEYAQAANFYRSYRRESPDSPNRKEVDRLIVDMDKAAAELRAKQPPTGTEPPREVQPPSAPSAETKTPAIHAVATPAPQKPLAKRAWFWGVMAGGAVVVAAGVTLAVVFGAPARDPNLAFGQVAGN